MFPRRSGDTTCSLTPDQCGASTRCTKDALSQLCCKSVSSYSAELKDYVVRPGRESALVQLAAARKIQEIFILLSLGTFVKPCRLLAPHQDASLQRRRRVDVPQRLSALRNASYVSSIWTIATTPTLRTNFPFSTPLRWAAPSAALPHVGCRLGRLSCLKVRPLSLCLPLLFARGGGIAGRGGWGGMGGLGGAGNVPPLEQALRALAQSSPRTRILLPGSIHPRTQIGLKDVSSFRRRKARGYVSGRWAPPSASAWPPRT
jgi:hypothetical protein